MIKYTKEYIAKLLDKYMDGTSTLEEEDVMGFLGCSCSSCRRLALYGSTI